MKPRSWSICNAEVNFQIPQQDNSNLSSAADQTIT